MADRTVVIVERSTGREVARTPLIYRAANYQVTDREFFDLAWRAAVEDKLVEAARREDFDFSYA